MRVSGKNVLITGGAVRVGRALCLGLAKAGAKVIIHHHRSVDAAKTLLAELGGGAAGHRLTRGDLTDATYAKNLIRELGQVDILINNASIFEATPIENESWEQTEKQFAVNFHAPVNLARSVHAQGLSQAIIINALDQRIMGVDPLGGGYALAKKALAEFTLSAAARWAPRTRVNAIAPGPVLPPVGMENSNMKISISKTPMNHPIPLGDIVSSCLFLISNESVTGQILYVDGGEHCNRRATPLH